LDSIFDGAEKSRLPGSQPHPEKALSKAVTRFESTGTNWISANLDSSDTAPGLGLQTDKLSHFEFFILPQEKSRRKLR
jgi:hypothetical protein